jgi:hypothetical protein
MVGNDREAANTKALRSKRPDEQAVKLFNQEICHRNSPFAFVKDWLVTG